ncbi:hypothetical protein A2757_00405 [Candidatus Giovannonibacteria bacterium RIFCSPHIGHO2_01_FULL_48_47]|nr:MAG: hypothetical protein A2757_00405 [Candidatus Giovannonibacteria bacterium RIFCSPHIGHO2_01_FULL_48_47]OGF68365.1 MAG: hypothetical protein A3D61_00585 [Candidatus Giovannonibacteria bacterium RIFCSPHIGHO2_02_FULL_48_15]OGF88733.1 MAG: hypothetical protein A3B26_00030 [Candidatus Giovannonibacteria bacterium RIFCSPLOWO2_01_FULL_48_47]OGF95539.1 MAG: hypothetical protein A2433_02305 [Candidatus Giovannonibacteria bacterium RIFOXYC1_FULL_48_8]OGF96180.1 MAG: hypothetical protein A2613_01265
MKHIGIIGIGYQGRKLADIFSSQAEIVMCASRGNAERIAALKKRHPSIAVTNDYRDLLSDSKIEGVVIATPIDTHAAMASEALKAGKHVFVEKPLATDKKTARALVEEAGAHNLSIFTGYTFLYHPCFFELQRILRDRPIESLYASWYKCGSFNEDILWNLLVHDIAIVIALCGEPRKLTLEGTYRAITDADVAYVHGVFGNNTPATFTVDRIAPVRSKLIEFVLADRIVAWHGDTLSIYDNESKEYREHFTSPSSDAALENEIQIFLKSMGNPAIAAENANISLSTTRAVERLKS